MCDRRHGLSQDLETGCQKLSCKISGILFFKWVNNTWITTINICLAIEIRQNPQTIVMRNIWRQKSITCLNWHSKELRTKRGARRDDLRGFVCPNDALKAKSMITIIKPRKLYTTYLVARAFCRTRPGWNAWCSWGWGPWSWRGPGFCRVCPRRCAGSSSSAHPRPSWRTCLQRRRRSWRCSCTCWSARTPCWSGMPTLLCGTVPGRRPGTKINHKALENLFNCYRLISIL